MYREDGSYYNESQLRNGGRFIKERIQMTLSDRLFLEKNGYSMEEAKQACRMLNIEIDNAIRAGENEKTILKRMKQVFDKKQNCFVDP